MDDMEFLIHYGILGMKWGVRRKHKTPTSKSTKKPPTPDEIKKIHERLLKSTSARTVYKHRNNLSDKELRDRLNRIQMEKQLKEISSKELETGMKYVNNAIKLGKTANEIYTLYNSPLGKAIKTKLSKTP